MDRLVIIKFMEFSLVMILRTQGYLRKNEQENHSNN